MQNITFIGDIHGKLPHCGAKIGAIPKEQLGTTIAIGDVGMGFSYSERVPAPSGYKGFWDDCEYRSIPINRFLDLHKFGIDKFIRGNHDSPQECRDHPQYMGDYGYDEELDLFWLGGAWSIDWQWRTPGKSWWQDEQLSLEQTDAAFQLYRKVSPKIVVTHDCPESVTALMDFELLGDGTIYPTATGTALRHMHDYWQPDAWVFGHYHQRRERDVMGTKFICVEELGIYTIAV